MQLPEHVFHIAEASNWPSIERQGLLPADALLERAHPGEVALARKHRPKHTVLPTGVHIRDQAPMPEKALASCLVGMVPPQWYALVNAHVFFWLDPRRLNRQRAACGPRPQVVATVRTADLLSHHGKAVYVTPFNIGYALRKPARRGVATLVPYATWLESGWSTETAAMGGSVRSRAHAPAELLVRGPISAFLSMVCSVTRLEPGSQFVPSDA